MDEILNAVKLLIEDGFTIDHLGSPKIELETSMVVGDSDVYTVTWEESYQNTKHQSFESSEEAARFYVEKYIKEYESRGWKQRHKCTFNCVIRPYPAIQCMACKGKGEDL
jgi:hypothetical protein